MKIIETLIVVVSWEERFIKGFEMNLKENPIKYIIFFQYKGYEDVNKKNYFKAKSICKIQHIKFLEVELDFLQPKENWYAISRLLSNNYLLNRNVLLDITTMPRETIWVNLFFLEQLQRQVKYVYYRPKHYSNEWLSRDPREPRLIYKMSGISEFGKSTLLFVFSGHDYQRTTNLINYFEPQKLILVSQGDEKGRKLADSCLQEFNGNMESEMLELNTYDEQKIYDIVANKTEENLSNYNIIFSSLGPKSSAIPLFRINRAFPQSGLCYIPCTEFNPSYSEGIDLENIVHGEIDFKQQTAFGMIHSSTL